MNQTTSALTIKQMSFLVVDDHMLMRKLVSHQLESMGAEHIKLATNGKEALEILEESQAQNKNFDVVLLDWGMPVMSGIELLQLCKGRFEDTAFIMLTGESEKQNVLIALENGAASYIVKPVSHDMMQDKLSKVCSWLEKKRAH